MLHSIGRKQAPGDLVDMLLECHGRIRNFITLAVSAGERVDVPAAEIVDACTRVERYFGVALPLHVRDEEESILPRLRGLSVDVDGALASMHDQHDDHAPELARLLSACAAVRANPDDRAARAELLAVATALRSEFEEHLRIEEEILFPALRKLLPASEQAQIVSELRARRGT